MARTKAKDTEAPKPRARMGRPPKANAAGTALSLRGTPEWRDWLNEFAAHLRATQADAIDRMLDEGAVRHGFKRPPKRVH